MTTSPSQFAAKCHRVATVVPRIQKDANEQAARAIKPAWFAQAGLTPASRIAGRKVSIRDDTKGTRNVVTRVRWQGPVHLVEGPTSPHFIGAKKLGTRAGLRRQSRRVGAMAAFGGSNRGAFGGSRRRGAKALTIGSNVRAYAFHPGTTGRGFWKANKASARTIARTVYRGSAVPAILRQSGFGAT